MRHILGGLMAVLILGFWVQSASASDVEMTGNVSVSGSMNAAAVTGDGSGLTNIQGTAISNTSITVNQLASNAVTADKLASDAVTPGKIAFYSRVAIVDANAGGNSLGYYTDPAYAMTHYSDWCSSPSATTPCLLKIMPGVYDIGSSDVMMRSYIDIEGSGENVTRIKGNIVDSLLGVVNGANNAELRFLTVEHMGGGNYSSAMYNSSASPKITNVTAIASSASANNYGIYNDNSSPKMTNVTVNVTGTGSSNSRGIYNYTSSPSMMNVNITVSGGSTARGIDNNASSAPLMIQGLVNVSGASTWNIGIDNSASSAPEMDAIKIVASGGVNCTGLSASSSQPSMFNVKIDASGGSSFTRGVYSSGTSTIKIKFSSIKSTQATISADAGGEVRVALSHFDGLSATGNVICAGVVDKDSGFLVSSCH